MPLTTTCLLETKRISIRAALKLRTEAKVQNRPPHLFQCMECRELVDPPREGPGSPARFEHRVRNGACSLSFPRPIPVRAPIGKETAWISTPELAKRTAGGDGYIRTKDGVVKGLALKRTLNSLAPNIIVVGKGLHIEARAALFLGSGVSVPAYIKRATNAWELIGQYRAVAYRTDQATIKRDGDGRDVAGIAGILYTERTDEVAINICGGGFADPAARKAVELAAIAYTQAHYEAQGYTVHDHQLDNLGYDLRATKPGSVIKLEVKGTGGPVSRFYLTRNERKCAASDAHWRIAIVTNAMISPRLEVLTAQQVENLYQLDPLAWECTLLPA